jgi:mediator of RNA polymerase II transcription subunit 7
MAEQPQTNALASLFPTPPPFWQSFTTENTNQIEELHAAQGGADYVPNDPATSIPIRLLDLPSELRLLQPPEPPKDGVYRCFGDTYKVCTFSERASNLALYQ